MPIYTNDPYDDGFFPVEPSLRSSIGIGPKVTKAIDDATRKWLDDHPEATTTVEDDSLTNAKLKDGSVNSRVIEDESITTDDIADLAVTTPKIADLAVTTPKIADNAVTAAKIASAAADGLRTMSATQPGVAKVGAGLAMNDGAIELDGNGDIATAVTSWLNAHPEATTTVQDGAVTDAKLAQTGGILSRVETYELSSVNYDFGFMLGTVDQDGVYYSTAESYFRMRTYYIPVYEGDVFTVGSAGNILSVHLFGADGNYVGQLSNVWTNKITVPSDGFAVALMRKTDDSNITIEEVPEIGANLRLISSGAAREERVSKILHQNALLDAVVWDSRYFVIDQDVWGSNIIRAGIQSIITIENDIVITVADGFQIGYGLYSGTDLTLSDLIYHSNWLSGETFIPSGSNIYLLARKSDGSKFKSYELYDKITFNAFKAAAYGKVVDVTWTKGTTNADGTITADGNGAISQVIALTNRVQLSVGCRAVMLLYKGSTYLGKLNASDGIDKQAGNWRWFTGNIDVMPLLEEFGADSVCICVIPTDSTTLTDATVQAYGDNNCTVIAEKFVSHDWLVENYGSLQDGNGSVAGADFIKRNVKTTLLGTLSRLQAFCVYGGKYYSTNGSELVIQDSSFDVEQTVSLNLGHGNSLQLGSNGIAYASGWNDDKVYAVNLSTLTLDSTINLPTLGYTTAAIDDVNGIAYIFQRDSYPDTVAVYNFITYDYANNNVLSTRKVKAFAAMQACDYHEGRIIVAYGLGTSTAPSGMFVCNTAGDILAEYDLDIFASTEPEGVCFDRDTGELLVSLVNQQLYKIEKA